MISRSHTGSLGLVLALGVLASGCGGDAEGPTAPPTPSDVAGRYGITWTIQVLRKSDGFQKQFYCYGSLTLSETGWTGSTTALEGFASVTSGCAPESYDLRGSIGSGGVIEFTTNGPKPPEGPCPGGRDVAFSGQFTTSGSYRSISARGVSAVTCPQFGDHELTYLIQGSR